MSQNLLIEDINPLLTESKKDSAGKWMIEGIFCQGGIKNKNGRLYPPPVLKEAVGKYHTEYISQNRALGELNHPPRPKVDPGLAVIKINSLTEDGNNWVGKATLLNTQQGLNLQALLEADVKVGVSTRALGSLKESGGVNVVQGDLVLGAVDCVLEPSAPDAWVSAIMEETEWVYLKDTNTYVLAEELKTNIKKASRTEREQKILESWFKYCKHLKF